MLVQSGLRGPRADNGVRRFTEDGSDAAGRDDDGFGGERSNFHAAQVHGADAAADVIGIENCGEEFPSFVLGNLAFGFVAAYLLIERVQKLLAGGGAGKRSAVEQRSAETAEVEQAFRRAVKRNAHAIEQIDDAGRSIAHALDRRLVGEEVAAVNGVVKMLPGGIAFALQVLGCIDATLSAH